MKKTYLIVLSLFMVTTIISACTKEGSEESAKADSTLKKPTELIDQGSYAIGFDIVNNMTATGMKLNEEYYIKGVRDALRKATNPLLNADERARSSQQFNDSMRKAEVDKVEKILVETRKLEAKLPEMQKDFFEKNKKKNPSIIQTPSGIQIEVVKAGTGRSIASDDIVKMHLKASFVNGEIFEDSKEKNGGKPASVPGQGVIPGWKEAMAYTKEFGVYRFYFPAKLAFGDEGMFPKIPGGTIMIFEVDIQNIEGKFDPQKMPMPQRPQVQGRPGQMPMPGGMMPPGRR